MHIRFLALLSLANALEVITLYRYIGPSGKTIRTVCQCSNSAVLPSGATIAGADGSSVVSVNVDANAGTSVSGSSAGVSGQVVVVGSGDSGSGDVGTSSSPGSGSSISGSSVGAPGQAVVANSGASGSGNLGASGSPESGSSIGPIDNSAISFSNDPAIQDVTLISSGFGVEVYAYVSISVGVSISISQTVFENFNGVLQTNTITQTSTFSSPVSLTTTVPSTGGAVVGAGQTSTTAPAPTSAIFISSTQTAPFANLTISTTDSSSAGSGATVAPNSIGTTSLSRSVPPFSTPSVTSATAESSIPVLVSSTSVSSTLASISSILSPSASATTSSPVMVISSSMPGVSPSISSSALTTSSPVMLISSSTPGVSLSTSSSASASSSVLSSSVFTSSSSSSSSSASSSQVCQPTAATIQNIMGYVADSDPNFGGLSNNVFVAADLNFQLSLYSNANDPSPNLVPEFVFFLQEGCPTILNQTQSVFGFNPSAVNAGTQIVLIPPGTTPPAGITPLAFSIEPYDGTPPDSAYADNYPTMITIPGITFYLDPNALLSLVTSDNFAALQSSNGVQAGPISLFSADATGGSTDVPPPN